MKHRQNIHGNKIQSAIYNMSQNGKFEKKIQMGGGGEEKEKTLKLISDTETLGIISIVNV